MITQQEFFTVLQTGYRYTQQQQLDYMRQLRDLERWFLPEIFHDFDDEVDSPYFYDNECYLMIHPDCVRISSNRGGTPSEGKSHKMLVTRLTDLDHAWQLFKSMAQEPDSDNWGIYDE